MTEYMTPMETALSAVPDKAAALAAAAVRTGIQPDDPAWGLVQIAVDVVGVGQSVGEVKSLLASLPREIRDGAKSAADDLKSEVLLSAKEVAQTIATGVDANIQQQTERAKAEWKAALGRADAAYREVWSRASMITGALIAVALLMTASGGTAIVEYRVLTSLHRVTPLHVALFKPAPGQLELTSTFQTNARYVSCHKKGDRSCILVTRISH